MRVISALLLLALSLSFVIVSAVPHSKIRARHHAAGDDAVMTELNVDGPLPGEQCFSSHNALDPNGEEARTLHSYKSFCER